MAGSPWLSLTMAPPRRSVAGSNTSGPRLRHRLPQPRQLHRPISARNRRIRVSATPSNEMSPLSHTEPREGTSPSSIHAVGREPSSAGPSAQPSAPRRTVWPAGRGTSRAVLIENGKQMGSLAVEDLSEGGQSDMRCPHSLTMLYRSTSALMVSLSACASPPLSAGRDRRSLIFGTNFLSRPFKLMG
jgi:hypothetical protein